MDPAEMTLYAVAGTTPAAYRAHLERGGMPMPSSTHTMKEQEHHGLHELVELNGIFDAVRDGASRRDWLCWWVHHVEGRHERTFYYEEEVRYRRGAKKGTLKPIFYSKGELVALPDAAATAKGWNRQAEEGERVTAEQVEAITRDVCGRVESLLRSRGKLKMETGARRKGEVEE